MAQEALSKTTFSIFFQLILERCFGANPDVQNLSREMLFGYNKGLNWASSIRGVILQKTGQKINGRELSNTVNRYQYLGKTESFEVQSKIIRIGLKFLHFTSLDEMEQYFFQERKIPREKYDPPGSLLFSTTEDGNGREEHTGGNRSAVDEKLANLKDTNWYYYTHYLDMQEGFFDSPQILRLPLRISEKGTKGNYSIELSQNEPYTTFEGEIIRDFSGDNILVCELSSKGKRVPKRLYLYIHVDLNATGSLFAGSFMRYSDGGTIYTGCFIMEKVKDQEWSQLEPKRFNYVEEEPDQPSLGIRKFLYDKAQNLVRLPTGIFTETDLSAWLERHTPRQSNPMPEIDLYVTAPIRGFETKLLHENWSSEFYQSPETFKELREQINTMIEDLKNRFAAFENVWYFPGELGSTELKNLDPNYVLDLQLKNFRLSKRILIILPFPSITSTILQAGWTMLVNAAKPIYICYSSREDLPFLLRKADTLKHHRIYMTSLRKIGGIAGIPDWINNNEYQRLY